MWEIAPVTNRAAAGGAPRGSPANSRLRRGVGTAAAFG